MIKALECAAPLEQIKSQSAVASFSAVNKSYGSVTALHGIDFQVRCTD